MPRTLSPLYLLTFSAVTLALGSVAMGDAKNRHGSFCGNNYWRTRKEVSGTGKDMLHRLDSEIRRMIGLDDITDIFA